MLLVIDVGNTNTVLGLYDDDKLIHDWRIRTEIDHTVDEYGMLIFNLYQSSRIRTEQLKEIKDIIISCVVPPMLNILEPVCIKYFHVKPIIIGPGIRTGMPIYYDNPKEVGADRIVNAVAAYHKYHRAAIIIDFGTATTFDYISPKGEYMGGCIAPGILISIEALFQRAAKLPRVEFSKPKTVITKDTVSAMQAGIIFGYAGLIDGIVQRMKNEAKTDPMVIATGGLAAIVATETKSIERVEEMLTLEGLRIIYHMNKK
ncbi:MAG: type III pantothenate kinase [Smithellaceae bacterium]